MADLNQLELKHLRHLIGAHETAYQKLNTYSSQAVDPQIKQLFTKFQCFDMEKNAAIEGTGLGMAITQGLMELMDGEIQVKSKYGEENVYQVKSIDIFKFDDNITKELQHIKVGAI